MKPERRFIKSEIRATEGDSPKIIGHGAMFNVRSLDLGGFVEIILPGAFDECLASGPDIVGLWNHNEAGAHLPLGRTSSGTMKVAVDDVGLRYEIEPADIQISRDLITSIRRKDVQASSFGFFCLDDTWDLERDTNTLIRKVAKAEVFDCSPVIFPAYTEADAGLRSQLRAQFAAKGETRSMGIASQELRSRLPEIRLRLQQESQGDADALAWHLRATELLNAAERF